MKESRRPGRPPGRKSYSAKQNSLTENKEVPALAHLDKRRRVVPSKFMDGSVSWSAGSTKSIVNPNLIEKSNNSITINAFPGTSYLGRSSKYTAAQELGPSGKATLQLMLHLTNS